MNSVELALLRGLLWGKGGYSRRGSEQSIDSTGNDGGIDGKVWGSRTSRRDSGVVVRSRVGSPLTAPIERGYRAGICRNLLEPM